MHEGVEASKLLDDRRAGLKHEMVSVAKKKLEAQGVDKCAIERFDRTIGANGDEVGSVNDAVWGVNPTNTCF